LYFRYSTRPKRLPTENVINHDRESAVAASGFNPMRPKKRTKAPSLTPRPETEIGIMEMRMIRGKYIKNARKGICCPSPIERT
jgi:hypothetical protein